MSVINERTKIYSFVNLFLLTLSFSRVKYCHLDVVCGEKSSFLWIWYLTVSSDPKFVLKGIYHSETWQSCLELITTLVRLWFISRPGCNYRWFIVSTPGCWCVLQSHDPVNISTETTNFSYNPFRKTKVIFCMPSVISNLFHFRVFLNLHTFWHATLEIAAASSSWRYLV